MPVLPAGSQGNALPPSPIPGKDTDRPFRVQEDIGEFDDQGVRWLIIRFLQGIWQQLRAGGLHDHLERETEAMRPRYRTGLGGEGGKSGEGGCSVSIPGLDQGGENSPGLGRKSENFKTD